MGKGGGRVEVGYEACWSLGEWKSDSCVEAEGVIVGVKECSRTLRDWYRVSLGLAINNSTSVEWSMMGPAISIHYTGVQRRADQHVVSASTALCMCVATASRGNKITANKAAMCVSLNACR